MNTKTTKTPIRCPLCIDKINPDCKCCEGRGFTYQETIELDDTITVDFGKYEPITVEPHIPPYSPWPTTWPNYPIITWTSNTLFLQ